jgi:hypothetical protein
MSQPTPPQPPPTPWPPVPMTPPPNPPGVPPLPRYCCFLAAGGDECPCADDFAEVLWAFESPLVWEWDR